MSTPRLCTPGSRRPRSTRTPGPAPPPTRHSKELEKEVRELRRANAILKSIVGLSIAAECDRPSR